MRTTPAVFESMEARELMTATLTWSSFLGGSKTEYVKTAMPDSQGNMIVYGSTNSANFPARASYDTTYNGGTAMLEAVGAAKGDAFVAKFNAAGALLWATYLGGRNDDWATGVRTDSTGNLYVIGNTQSTNFPTTAGAFDRTFNGNTSMFDMDLFVTKLSPAGAMLWSTYLGGNGIDMPSCIGIEIGSLNKLTIVGSTSSRNFPTKNAWDSTFNDTTGNTDCFIARMTSAGAMEWSTFMGGSKFDSISSWGLGASDTILVGGATASTNFPTSAGAIDRTYNGGELDAFAAKFSSSGQRIWGTFLGGNGADYGGYARNDSAGNSYFFGTTSSTNFAMSGGYDTTYGGAGDGWMIKTTSGGTKMWSTFVGGSGVDQLGMSGFDGSGNIYIGGSTKSTNMRTTTGLDTTFNGVQDMYVGKITAAGAFVWGTYFGGSGLDDGWVDVAPDRNVMIVGNTKSSNLPMKGAYDSTFNGGQDIYIARFNSIGKPIFSTYFGGSGVDTMTFFAIDSAGRVLLAGNTKSTNFPTRSAADATFNGVEDGFVARFSAYTTMTAPASASPKSSMAAPIAKHPTSAATGLRSPILFAPAARLLDDLATA